MEKYQKNNRSKQKKGKLKKQNLVKLLALVVLLCLAVVLYKEAPSVIFPVEYGGSIVKYAKENGIDPLLVCAIIKSESGFDPEAKSKAGAIGLMQLMPNTAEWLANKHGIDYDEEKLTESDYNIQLGCLHLDFVLDYWENDLVKAAASYNAGQSNVADWLKEGIWDGTSETVENIPFSETRNYVEKILRNYEGYKKLYGNDLRFQK